MNAARYARLFPEQLVYLALNEHLGFSPGHRAVDAQGCEVPKSCLLIALGRSSLGS
jgi:hypothetical protein